MMMVMMVTADGSAWLWDNFRPERECDGAGIVDLLAHRARKPMLVLSSDALATACPFRKRHYPGEPVGIG
jgi:hypothetical protein